MDTDGTITRGDLLHWYQPGYAHFVTYRLVDSIPKNVLKQIATDRAARIHTPQKFGIHSDQSREIAHKLYFQEYDQALAAMPSVRFLEQNSVANIIRENLYHHNGTLYELLAWCVMSNHVHILIQPFEIDPMPGTGFDSVFSDEIADNESVLSRIMHSLKSYTANQANRILNRTGRFWQRESYDHWVRDLDELERIVEYIKQNPVKAGLCETPLDWEYSSAYDRFQKDGSECGMVGQLRNDWKQKEIQ